MPSIRIRNSQSPQLSFWTFSLIERCSIHARIRPLVKAAAPAAAARGRSGWKAFPSSQRRGGCAERSEGADGVVRPANRFGRVSIEASPYFLRLRAIALALRAGSRFAPPRRASPLAVAPPLLCEEGNTSATIFLPPPVKLFLPQSRFESPPPSTSSSFHSSGHQSQPGYRSSTRRDSPAS